MTTRPKRDFTKSLRNRNLNDVEPSTRARHSWTLNCEVDPRDVPNIHRFMQAELSYYNQLVDTFNRLLQSQSDRLALLDDQWVKLFGILARLGINCRSYTFKKEDHELPADLEPYRALLLGRPDGKRTLSEAMMIIMEVAGGASNINELVREYMAVEILKHYREQAVIVSQSSRVKMNDQVYRSAIQVLETLDNVRKRHLQIPRRLLNLTWHEKEQVTRIQTPYMSQPIVVREQNLTEEKGWNILVLHQEPGRMPSPQTPWQIELRTVKHNYLVRYVEATSPYAGMAFYKAKSKTFTSLDDDVRSTSVAAYNKKQ